MTPPDPSSGQSRAPLWRPLGAVLLAAGVLAAYFATHKPVPPENLPAPLIDYLAKDYGSFRRLMLDRLSVIMPDWTERNPADPQVVKVTEASVTYVAIDDAGQPRQLPGR